MQVSAELQASHPDSVEAIMLKGLIHQAQDELRQAEERCVFTHTHTYQYTPTKSYQSLMIYMYQDTHASLQIFVLRLFLFSVTSLFFEHIKSLNVFNVFGVGVLVASRRPGLCAQSPGSSTSCWAASTGSWGKRPVGIGIKHTHISSRSAGNKKSPFSF